MKAYYNLTQDEQNRVKRLVDQEIYCRASLRMIEENSDELAFSDFFENVKRDEEILNFWFISSWLQDKLEECQEYVTDDFLDMCIWGNTSGGALYTHPAIVAICFDEINEYIERYEEDEEDE